MLPPLRVSRLLLLGVFALCLPACLERKQTGVLNPDGSGKMTLETTFAPPPPPPGQPALDPVEVAHGIAAKMVQDSLGVDVWKDITCDKTADGRAHVVATAYFPDINKLQLDNPMPIGWTKNADGSGTLILRADRGEAPPGPRPNLTDAQIARAVSEGKAEYEQNKASLVSTLATLKVQASLTLPGKVTANNILTRSADNQVSLAFNGTQVLNAMDKVMSDNQGLAEAVRNGRQPDDNQALMLETIFGQKGAVSATVAGPMQVQFNYAAEVAAAKAAAPAMYQRLGIDPNARPAPMPGTVAPQPVPPR